MPKNRLIGVIALGVAALLLAVVLVIMAVSLGGPPDCEQAREDNIDEDSYARLGDFARFTEALAVLEHDHKNYKSLGEARKLTVEFANVPELDEALVYYKKHAPPDRGEADKGGHRGKGNLGVTYVSLAGISERLTSALDSNDRGRIARTVKAAGDLLTNLSAHLGADGQSMPPILAQAQTKVQSEVDALRVVQYACGHCGDPKANRVPVDAEKWTEYRCDKQREGCLDRDKYSDFRGLGCPGQGAEAEFCCPPAGACAVAVPGHTGRSGSFGALLVLGALAVAGARRRLRVL